MPLRGFPQGGRHLCCEAALARCLTTAEARALRNSLEGKVKTLSIIGTIQAASGFIGIARVKSHRTNANTGQSPCSSIKHAQTQRRQARAASQRCRRPPFRGKRQSRSGGQESFPWQSLNFLPLPQGQGSLRPTCTPSGKARGSASATSPSSAWPSKPAEDA